MFAEVLHQVLVADSDTQQEASRKRLLDGALSVGHRHRVAGVDVGDSGGGLDGGRALKQERGHHERVPSDRLGVPDRPEAQFLCFGREFDGVR